MLLESRYFTVVIISTRKFHKSVNDQVFPTLQKRQRKKPSLRCICKAIDLKLTVNSASNKHTATQVANTFLNSIGKNRGFW